MEPQRVSPIEGLVGFLSGMMRSIDGESPERIGWDEVGNICISTVVPLDTEIPETGIDRPNLEGKWVIVEQYANNDNALLGHQKWVKLMTEHPDFPLKDIDMWSLQQDE